MTTRPPATTTRTLAASFRQAMEKVIQRARDAGTTIAVWEQGVGVVKLDPFAIGRVTEAKEKPSRARSTKKKPSVEDSSSKR